MENLSLNARCWLDDLTPSNTGEELTSKHYHHKKININKVLQSLIAKHLKNNDLEWVTLCQTALVLLINRFGNSDQVFYTSANTNAKTLNDKQAIFNTHEIRQKISGKLTVHKLYDHLHKVINKEYINDKKQKLAKGQRLLLLTHGSKPKKNQILQTDIQSFPLVIYIDPKKYSSITWYFGNKVTGQTLKEIFEYYLFYLKMVLIHFEDKINAIPSLRKKDEKLILEKWSKSEYSNLPEIKLCINKLFLKTAKKYPDAIAVKQNETAVTYRELDNASSELAVKLQKENIHPGDFVCVLMERTPALITAMLAIFKAGAIYVPINPKFPPERINYILDDTKAKHIIINDIDRLPKKYHKISLQYDDGWTPASDISKTPKLTNEVSLNSVAYIIYTSGTTGTPKGVKIKHKNLVNLVRWYHGVFKINKNDRSAQFASQAFDTYICETLPFLTVGASIHIIGDNAKLSPSAFLNWLKSEEITICDLPTAYAKMLFSLSWPDKLSLKTLKVGGEAITTYPYQKFSFDIWNGYGPTETTVETTYYRVYKANSSPTKKHACTKPPIGRPITGTSAYILDKDMRPVPIGVPGELLIGGDGICDGYLNLDKLSKTRFTRNPFEPNKNDYLYHTGDLARWLPDGNIDFIGRADHQVKISGYRIELDEIKSSLNQYPDVNEVVVLLKEDINGDKSLVAYVEPNLNKQRFLYQERCLISINNNKYMEAITEDISKNGVAISGITDTIPIGQHLKILIRPPGSNESKLLSANLVWQHENRCGIVFDLNEENKKILSKSIDYYLSTHNVMEMVLTASSKRSLKRALRKKLPDYMIPNTFVTLLQFPLTYSGKIDMKSLPPPQEFEQKLQRSYIPPTTETEKDLSKIWAKLLDNHHISMSDSFFELGGSSLTAAELSILINQQFNIVIPTQVLFDFPYIPIHAKYIDSQGKTFTYQAKSSIQEGIEQDAMLPGSITPVGKSGNLKSPGHILLTGAGGFLGIYLLKELLENTNAKIYCLVRTHEFESAAKRLLATIKKFNLEKDISLSNRRIIAISGDISFANLGMPYEQYDNLAKKIEMIFHCGAQVNIMAAYGNLRGSNVQGTMEVIKFATQYIDKPIHYISTLSSATIKDKKGMFSEAFPNSEHTDLFGGYAISKWISERLLTQLKDRGLPVSIYRSGYIAGDSKSFIMNLNDALFMLIKGCIQLGFAPLMKEKITILPVDYVSRLITAIALKHGKDSQVYHIDHPTGILWPDLVSWLNRYGYKITLISIKEWQKKLLHISKENALYPFLPYYLGLPEDYHSPDVSIKHAKACTKDSNLPYPEINDVLLKNYFKYLREIGFLPEPGKIKSSVPGL